MLNAWDACRAAIASPELATRAEAGATTPAEALALLDAARVVVAADVSHLPPAPEDIRRAQRLFAVAPLRNLHERVKRTRRTILSTEDVQPHTGAGLPIVETPNDSPPRNGA